MTPTELRQRGLEALTQALGYVGMVRFLQQLDAGNGDYTQDRHQWQDQLAVPELIAQIKQHRGQPER